MTNETGASPKENIQRYTELQRNQVRLEGERGQVISQAASARAKISETELQSLQLEKEFLTDVGTDRRAWRKAHYRRRSAQPR